MNQHPSSAVIMRVFKRDRFTCTYCGVNGSEAELQCDHIIPISKGGSNHIANLTTACRKCNQSKGNRTKTLKIPKMEMYFVLKDQWFKLESIDINQDVIFATVIDPFFHEYESVYIKNKMYALKFFKDKYEFLVHALGEEEAEKQYNIIYNLNKDL